ncbi:hypothetical protein [Candidatus Nitrospira bockiana]
MARRQRIEVPTFSEEEETIVEAIASDLFARLGDEWFPKLQATGMPDVKIRNLFNAALQRTMTD